MNVLIIPYGETNAYHKLLSESLKIQGVKVKKGINTTFFPILRQTLSEKIDIIHIEWTDIFFIRKNIIYSRLRAYAFIFELLIIKKILKKKIAWRVHNRYNHEQLHLDLDLHVSRFLAYFSDLIEVECPNAKEEIIDLFSIENPSKIKIIPMGNYIGAYQNSISKKEAKEKIGIKDDNFAYLYFGKIRPYKGVFNLISAFKNFSRHEQDRLILAGRPKDAQLQSLIEDKIKNDDKIIPFFSFIPDDEIQIYMNAADVVILPYTDILSSGAALLALSFGKPIIAPAIGCIPQVLDNHGSILYDPDQEEGMINAMKSIKKCNLSDMGKHNYQKSKDLNWDLVGKMTASELSKLIQ